MIVDKIRALYEGTRKASTGNVTGSRLGTCSAQLQMLRFPEISQPEIPMPRTIMTWEEGDRIEAWLAACLHKTFPDLTGLRQEPFYFRVPIADPGVVDALREQIGRRKGDPAGPSLWGAVYEDRPFIPPSIKLIDGRVKLRLMPCGDKCAGGQHGWGCGKKRGFILDPKGEAGPGIWVPTYLDFVMLHPTLGLVVLEAKSMSNFAFRRALLGDLDYGKRTQLVGMTEATGLDIVLIGYRKETSHLAEIAYTKTVTATRVLITKMNGQAEAYFVSGDKLVPEVGGGAPVDIPADVTWETAEVWTPRDPRLLAEIHARVLAVLTAEPGKWQREYGPDFTCVTCNGAGTQTMAKTTKQPLKKAKPCEDCEQRGYLLKTTLPNFPCGYCPVPGKCWEAAGVTLEITDKPRYWVTREQYLASGLSFTTPTSERTVAPAPAAAA